LYFISTKYNETVCYSLPKLRSGGVEFSVELTRTPWAEGKYAIFKDLDGNEFWM